MNRNQVNTSFAHKNKKTTWIKEHNVGLCPLRVLTT